jgi:hypothetical protein
MRTIKSFLAVALVAAGALFIGVSAASAATTSSSTTLTANVPSTLSLSGLAASYSAVAPSGLMTPICTGPLTVTTNNPGGYTLTLTWANANFVSGANSFSIRKDMSTRADTSCANPGTLADNFGIANNPVPIFSTVAPGSDTFDIVHQITVPAGQPAGAYAVNVTYTVTDN